MLHLEMKHLRLVVTIAETGNLTRAAQALCLSQPALSKQLAELETQLGFALFHRTRKAMCLTEPGRSFRQHAESILGDMRLLEVELIRHGSGATGKLRLGIDRVHHSTWLPAVMGQFRRRHPRIELEIKQVPELLCSLQRREIDIAIIGEAVEAAGVDYVALNDDELVAVLPLTHPLRQKDYIGVHDLEGEHLIYYFALEQSYLYRRYLYPNRIRLGSCHRIENIDAIIALIKSGEGMSILPASLVQDAVHARTLAVCPIGQQGFGFTWHAALASDAQRPYAAEFVDLLSAAVSGPDVTFSAN